MTHRHPNLVFVLADQLRRSSVGYAGDPVAQTPHIDSLRAQGVSFDHAVATAPVCAGMRATMLSGTYPSTNGMAINELRLNPAQRCLGHVLTDSGYDTSYIGKWHLFANELGNHADPTNSFVPRGPDRLGFDGGWAAYNFHHRYYEAWYHTESKDRMLFPSGTYEPDGQTDLAIDFVRGRAAETDPRPFALFLAFGTPHDPWDDDNAPETDRNAFEGVAFDDPPNVAEANDPYGDFWSQLSPADRASLPQWRRNYYAMTRNLDGNVGRLLAALDDCGVAEDTVVVFTSDHGEMFGAHGRRAKNIFYDEAARVPFVIRHPGRIPASTHSDACIGSVDIAPTIAGLLGLRAADDWEGTDASAAASGSGDGPEVAFLQGLGPVALFIDGFEWRAVRTASHTFAVYRRDGSSRLFDNIEDPYQMHDLANESSKRALRSDLESCMRDRMAELLDTFEASTWYETEWTDGDRKIVAGARGPFGRPDGAP